MIFQIKQRSGRATNRTWSTFASFYYIRCYLKLRLVFHPDKHDICQIEAKQSGTCHIFFNPWQVVHPLMSTILVPVFALVGLNLRVLSRVPTASTRRSSSRRRCLFSPQMIIFVKNHKDHIRICFTLSTKNVPPALAKRGIFFIIISCLIYPPFNWNHLNGWYRLNC